MDAFGEMFRGVRAQGSLFGSSTLTAPWSLLFVDGAPLTLCTVLEGSGWILPEGHPPEYLTAGETLILRGPAPFSFVDEIGTAAEPIECGKECATPDQGGTRHRLGWHDGPHGGPDGATTLVTGAYPVQGEIGRRLLDTVPDVLRVAPDGTADAVRALLAAEVAVDAPGQQIVLDRLLDWMLVCSLREWFDRPGGEPRPGTPHTVTRSSAKRCGCCTMTRPHHGRSPPWPTGPGCHAPPSRNASPTWWANRR